MRPLISSAVLCVVLVLGSCSAQNTRGIADKRTDFKRFLPMEGNPAAYGFRPVKPFLHAARRNEILALIQKACVEHREGSSVYQPESGRGYYVNCNPRNRQFLNGYVSANPRKAPHSRRQ